MLSFFGCFLSLAGNAKDDTPSKVNQNSVDDLPWNISIERFGELVSKCGERPPEAALYNLFKLYGITDGETSERVADEILKIKSKISQVQFLKIISSQPYSTRQNMLFLYEDMITNQE